MIVGKSIMEDFYLSARVMGSDARREERTGNK
jgi:hypothetical protein